MICAGKDQKETKAGLWRNWQRPNLTSCGSSSPHEVCILPGALSQAWRNCIPAAQGGSLNFYSSQRGHLERISSRHNLTSGRSLDSHAVSRERMESAISIAVHDRSESAAAQLAGPLAFSACPSAMIRPAIS